MKVDIRKVRPCDSCGKKYGSSPFYVVIASHVMANPEAINATAGINMALGGRAPAIAEALSPSREYLIVMGEKDPAFWATLWVCQDCYSKPLFLAHLAEDIAERSDSAEEVG